MEKYFVSLMIIIGIVALYGAYNMGEMNGKLVGSEMQNKLLCDSRLAKESWCEEKYPLPPCKTITK